MDLWQKAKARLAKERTAYPVNRGASLRFALAFPNVYSVAMASLGYQLVYRMLNDLPDVSCERTFLPDPEDLREHERARAELFTLETQTPLAEHHVVAFSVSFELDYANALRILKLANLPLRAADRDERHPLVIAGGPCATFNPEPLAEFIDAFVVGEAEDVLPHLADAIRRTLGEDRERALEALAGVPGVYVPYFYRPEYSEDRRIARVEVLPPAPAKVSRAVASDLSAFPAASVIIAEDAEFGEIELVEVARGCGRKCRFCLAGHITRPPRPRAVEAGNGPRQGLVGAAVFDRPDAVEMCERIVESDGEFTVSSVRLETVTRELAHLMARGGQKTLTIAPEAGSDRMRSVINKCASESQMREAVLAAMEAGLERVKLYFMIGLPTETDEDIDAIAELSIGLAREFHSLAFQVSVSSLVPKPWTPFQWHPMEREKVLKRRYERLRKTLSAVRGVKFSGESPRLAAVQGLLSRGDRRIAPALEAALEAGGDLSAAMREVDTDWYLHRPRERDEVLPWDHVDIGIRQDYLWREYQNALAGVATAPCSVGKCRACGVCP